jgi:hypothetical protein
LRGRATWPCRPTTSTVHGPCCSAPADVSDEVDAGVDPSLSVRIRLLAESAACSKTVTPVARRHLRSWKGSYNDLDEIASGAYSNLTYLDVEQRRLRQATE